jgi:hypothetical protein
VTNLVTRFSPFRVGQLTGTQVAKLRLDPSAT